MPLLTATELRDVLGVSDSLYSDVYLEQIIASAEGAILPLLTQYKSAIVSAFIKDGVVYYETQRVNYFVPGQSVIIAGCGDFDGTVTVTADRVRPYFFTSATNDADVDLTPFIPAGTAVLDGATVDDTYANVAPVKSALLVVAVEVFQSIIAPGNTSASVDFQPTPFVLGRSLQNRVVGLLAPFLDVETMAV